MTSVFVAILGLLIVSPLGVIGVRRQYVKEQSNHTANNTVMAFHCPSLCVRCQDGQRSVLITRGKSAVKTVLDNALATNAVFNWFPGTTLFTATVAAWEKALIHKLGDECPNFEIWHIENDGLIEVPDKTVELVASKDDTLFAFKKSLGRIYDAEQKEKGHRPGLFGWAKSWWAYSRPAGKMPDVVMSQLDHSELFCGDNGGVVESMKKDGIVEEDVILSSQEALPIVNRFVSFSDNCKAVASRENKHYPFEE